MIKAQGETKKAKYIGSVMKAVEILEVISSSPDGMGVSEISKKINNSVGTTYHLVNTLRHCNMLDQDKKTKKYRIGYTAFRISGAAKEQNLLGSLAMSYLERLREKLHETANLSMMDGSNIVCVAQAEGQRMIRMFSKPGVSTPFYFTAGGKLLVSHQPREEWDSYISNVQFEQFTENTITSADELVEELELTLERGYGIDNEEREKDVVCIAAPVFDCYGEAVAAISISGLASRIRGHIEDIAEELKKTAMELSVSVGYHPE